MSSPLAYSWQLSGGLDTRSAPGAAGAGYFSFLQSVDGAEINQTCALGGWRRRGYSASCANNRDLHDQMLGGQTYGLDYGTYGYCYDGYMLGNNCRESITFLRSITGVDTTRRLMAGTRTRLYVSDDQGGNWRILADGLSSGCEADCDCSPFRFSAGTLGNITVLANGVDEVLYWQFDTGPEGCYGWSADYVQELRDLNVTYVAGVVEFGGFMIAWGPRMDNEDIPYRFLWSDYNAPLSWIPGGESIAGFQDLALGETIIAWMPIGVGQSRIYTNRAIYAARVVSDDRTFEVLPLYELRAGGPSLPQFQHQICSKGGTHYYLGEDELYELAEYDKEPRPSDWLHRASGMIFRGATDLMGNAIPSINQNAFDRAVVRYSTVRRMVIVSWPSGISICPDRSLFLWPETTKATYVDYGFNDLEEHQDNQQMSWRDYMGLLGICDPADSLLEKEGVSCPTEFTPVVYDGLWNATEDTSLPMSPDSWSARFCGICMADLCSASKVQTKLLMVSASDKTIKEFTPDSFVREELIELGEADFPEIAEATYEVYQYTVGIQAAAEKREGAKEKTFRHILAGYSSAESDSPPMLYASTGAGWTPGCLNWEEARPIAMECGDAVPNRRPGKPAKFNFWNSGVWTAWQMWALSHQFCIISIDYQLEEKTCR